MLRLRRIDLPTLRAAWWALRALRATRRTMRREGLRETTVGSPPTLPEHAVRGVHAVMRRRPNRCLERSLVLQRWHAAHGRPVDVIIGVAPGEHFGAHAWLEGDPDGELGPFHELSRVHPT